MRRVNKILMATVAILLCLVLISTSVVSGIFAKFIITKTAQTSMVIEKFGMRLIVTPDTTNLENAGATVNLTNQNSYKRDVIHVEITNLQMAPGDEFFDALRVQITGTPNVDIKFRMSCHIDYDTTQYKYNNKSYMPLGFTMRFSETGNLLDICYPYQENKDNEDIEEIIVRNMYNKIYNKSLSANDPLFKTDSSTDYYYETTYVTDTTKDNAWSNAPSNLKDFYLGFDFPDKGRNGNNKDIDRDAIATALSENAAGSSIKIIFSFTIEQA